MDKCHIPKVCGMVTVGERGQIVIPSDARKMHRIQPGDKLVVFTKPNGSIGLVPAESFSRFIDNASTEIARSKKE